MDETAIKKTLAGLTEEIKQIDERRAKLMAARSGLEALLDLQTPSTNGKARPLFEMPVDRTRTKPKGVISFRQAIRQTMQESGGQELHSAEILRRVSKLGATTEAKDPQGVVDLVLYSLKRDGEPLKKTDPRTWKWSGKTSE